MYVFCMHARMYVPSEKGLDTSGDPTDPGLKATGGTLPTLGFERLMLGSA